MSFAKGYFQVVRELIDCRQKPDHFKLLLVDSFASKQVSNQKPLVSCFIWKKIPTAVSVSENTSPRN